MKIISSKIENMSDYGKVTSAVVYSAVIEIQDIDLRAAEMIKTISDTSWLNNLKPVEQASFEARSEKTIAKLVSLIKSRAADELTADFGEYLISDSAQTLLEHKHGHLKVPLAELLKEKISGNPGFDFHTESKSNHISFGEAKYSSKINPYPDALIQIAEFIAAKKDKAELTIIQHFVSQAATDNALTGRKAYAAAFSINSNKPSSIVENALSSDYIDELLSFPEVYIIGVQVSA